MKNHQCGEELMLIFKRMACWIFLMSDEREQSVFLAFVGLVIIV